MSPGPSPTTTTKKPTGPTDKPTDGPTPNPTDGPGPTDGPTDAPPQTCCSSVMFESTGVIGTTNPEMVGTYKRFGTDFTVRSVCKKDSVYICLVNDV